MSWKNVLVNGCFVVPHPDHIRLFEFASGYGHLTVAINNDPYIYSKHGCIPVSLEDRIYQLKAIKYIDKVIVFDEPDASTILKRLKPEFYVKGPDYKDKMFPELIVCEEVGTKVVYAIHNKTYSSTELLKERR